MASISSTVSHGAIEKMLQGVPGIAPPVLQIKEAKKIRDGRWRAQLWDAVESYNYCMISTLASQAIEARLEPMCLLKVKNFHRDGVDNKIVIVITQCEVVASASEVGGKLLEQRRAPKRGASGDNPSLDVTPTKTARPPLQASPSTRMNLKRIDSLDPHQNRCTIRCRVSSKSEIITWRNAARQGTLFSFDVFDASGEISITAFNMQCENFYNLIEIGKVYLISGFHCEPSSETWKTNDHPYKLSLGMFSTVELCCEPCGNIPPLTYNFVPISALETVPAEQRVDICAILKSVYEPERLRRKSDGQPLSKRNVYIVDDSKKMVRLTVWHGAVEKIDRKDNPVVLIRRAEVQRYNDRTSISTRCAIDINPALDCARTLQTWWADGGKNERFEFLGGMGDREYVDFDVMNRISGNPSEFSERPLYLWNFATVVWFNRESAAYKACPSPGCAKKLQEQSDGSYFCEKCTTPCSSYAWRFSLEMTLSDATGELRCRAFGQEAEKILGVSAETFGKYTENNIDEMDQVFSDSMFKAFHFKFRGQNRDFRGKSEFQYTVAEVFEVDKLEDCRHLVDEIRSLNEFL